MDEIQVNPLIKHGWLRVIVMIIPYTLVVGLFQLAGLLLISQVKGKDFMELINQLENNRGDLSQFLVIQLFTLIGALLVIWAFRKVIDRRSLHSLGFSLRKKGKDIFLGILIGAVTMMAGSLILWAMGLLEITDAGFIASTFLTSLILCIAIALNEEILVRGYVLNNFMMSFNKYVALILSALLFAILHIFNPNTSVLGMFNLFLAGILLGASYIYTKNLWFPVALHFSWNFFQGPVFGFHVSGLDMNAVIIQKPQEEQLFSGGTFGFEGSILATILSLVMIAWVVYNFRGQEAKA
ncbi:CPBP family intramembrane metalloprotease [Fulvivirgaceae bacterium BMA12]|uniref:CPBP family intramembrane metalloprotease n=1 Tax=Agaribacillus aureus TaxID=3051825 RepID=A0ABT8LFA1_9BACT|nr:CPBP family intramembrane metalloprotease [Fulvivirgaceae bacterium BMA12]